MARSRTAAAAAEVAVEVEVEVEHIYWHPATGRHLYCDDTGEIHDRGKRDGVSTGVADKVKAPERKVRELWQANEIARKASAYCAQAALGPLRLPSDDAAHRRNPPGRLRPFRC